MIGARLGRWTLERTLGHGGMGHVYLGRDIATNERAAVKVLSPELATEQGFLHRFQREIEVLAKLNHPNIVRFLESGAENVTYYYVMEYVDGKSFEDIVVKTGKLSWQDVLEAALQICPALKHAHDHGIVHRDLKPPNLLRMANGIVKLADFGIAKVFSGTQLTNTGSVVGTAEFLSPEQAVGKQATKRSDIYSLGAVLYTLVTGRPPFQGRASTDIMHKHVYGQFEMPSRLAPDLPRELEEVICQCLEKDPEKRPSDALVLQRQLEHVQRKLERRSSQTESGVALSSTVIEQKGIGKSEATPPDPMRAHLRQPPEISISGLSDRADYFNRFWVLFPLLLLCIGAIAWSFWLRPKPSEQQLFEQGASLMQSDNPADWTKAWDEYLAPLTSRFPNGVHEAEVAAFKQRIDDYREMQRLLLRGPRAKSLEISEAQRFYRRALRLLQDGEPAQAQSVLQNLVTLYESVPEETQWVKLAQASLDQIKKKLPNSEGHEKAKESAEQRIRQLREAGKTAEADKMQMALDQLYRSDEKKK